MDLFFRYKFISFDLWGTLIKHNPEFSQHRNELIKSVFPEIYISDSDIKLVKHLSDYSNESLGEQLSWKQAILNILIINRNYKFIPKEQIHIRFNKLEIEQKTLFLKYHPTIFSEETLDVLLILYHYLIYKFQEILILLTHFYVGKTLGCV